MAKWARSRAASVLGNSTSDSKAMAVVIDENRVFLYGVARFRPSFIRDFFPLRKALEQAKITTRFLRFL
jgi:hypothetical protein